MTSSPPRKKRTMNFPTTGTAPAMPVPTLVAKNASSFQGRRYPLKPKPIMMNSSRTPVIQVSSRGFR